MLSFAEMPQFKLADYGVVGMLLLIILVAIYRLPDIISAIKSARNKEIAADKLSEDKNNMIKSAEERNETKQILQGLSVAITKLTVFLETEAAVNKEKDKVTDKHFTDIEAILEEILKLNNEILKLTNEHMIKCEVACNKK
jgi:hypothetical protein